MEKFDAEKAKRVWQRVQGEAQLPKPDWEIASLIAIKGQTASGYARLSRYFRGQTGVLMQKLYRQELEHIATLKGLCKLHGGQPPKVSALLPAKVPAEILLRQCYGQKQQLLAAYDKYKADPQHGGVFQMLIAQEQSQCRILLQLLGKLAK